MTHICVSKLTIIASDNGLPPLRRQAIIWTNAGMLLIGTLGTKFSEILSKIHTFSFKKMHLKTSSAKWRPFCLGLNVLTEPLLIYYQLDTLAFIPGLCLPEYFGYQSPNFVWNLHIWNLNHFSQGTMSQPFSTHLTFHFAPHSHLSLSVQIYTNC